MEGRHIGFRQPDAIEVKWNSTTGALQMGEIKMWEQWRKVGEGQEGTGREMQPTDVSTMSNKTDARDREGRAGAPSVLEGAQGRAGNTGREPEAGQDVAGAQGGTKRGTKAQFTDTAAGGADDGVCTYTRTYVYAYVRTANMR